MDSNPWHVESIQDFSFLNCPECTFKRLQDITTPDFSTPSLNPRLFNHEFFYPRHYYTRSLACAIFKSGKNSHEPNLQRLDPGLVTENA